MTIIRDDFRDEQKIRELRLEDFCGDTLRLVQGNGCTEGVDIEVTEGGETSTFALMREDAETLLGALVTFLIETQPDA